MIKNTDKKLMETKGIEQSEGRDVSGDNPNILPTPNDK